MKYLLSNLILQVFLVPTPNVAEYNACDINNPINSDYVDEISFNSGGLSSDVTQEEFNQRYADIKYVVSGHSYYIFSTRKDDSILYTVYIPNGSFFIDSHDLEKLKQVVRQLAN